MKNSIKRKYGDERVTARTFSFALFLLVFAVIFISACIAIAVWTSQDTQGGKIYLLLSSVTAIVIVSLLVSGIVVLIRRLFLMMPVVKISKAIKQISEGDYSVRLPQKLDGEKKNEFDVLFADFNLMAEELQSVEMLKNDFVSNVSHELKTPLASIINYVTLLKSENLTKKEQLEYLTQISFVCENLSQLVSAVLQLSKLENQKIKPVPQLFDLSEQLYRSILNYDTLFNEKNLDVEIDIADNIEICGDEYLIGIVWNNLLSNAVKFTPEHGTVSISLTENNDNICVNIRDTGIGMTQDEMKHIFDKFYQADASHATKGNGLGLTTVKKILELSDAAIAVESQIGNGTEFKITFPRS